MNAAERDPATLAGEELTRAVTLLSVAADALVSENPSQREFVRNAIDAWFEDTEISQ